MSKAAQGFVLFLIFLASATFSTLALFRIYSEVPEIWVPIFFFTILTLLFNTLSKLAKSGVALPFMTTIWFGGLFCWNLSRTPQPFEKWNLYFIWAPKVFAGLALLSALIWLITALSKKEKDLAWLGMIGFLACFLLVCFYSSSGGGKSHTVEFLMRTLSMTRDSAETVAFWLRKAIHFSFYGTLGFFAYRITKSGTERSLALWTALGMALTVASFDETRQFYSNGRTASAQDVVLDMIGATTFVLASYLTRKR